MKTTKMACRNKPSRDMPVRLLPVLDSNIRFATGKNARQSHQFTGYAVKWDSVNTYGEQFVRGAFAELIGNVASGTKAVYMYYNHGWREYIDSPIKRRIGKWTHLEEDDIGLKVTGELTAGLSVAEDVRAMLAHGTIDGLSICFYPPSPMDCEELNDRLLIKRADLYEISVVDEPSDRQARIDNTEQIDQMQDETDATRMLSGLGMNEAQARSFISKLDEILHPQPSAQAESMARALAHLEL